MPQPLLELTEKGLYCAAGGFYIDPCRAVERAVITHAHSDHARPGSKVYLASPAGAPLLRERVGAGPRIESIPFGEPAEMNGVRLSLHPAGHLLGSAQIRVERAGEVWVVSGDYKTEADRTCEPFEPLRCHTFITESTFGLPIFHWRPQAEIFAEINAWWRRNREGGRTSVLFAYSLGKAQRVLAGLDPSIGPIQVHGAVESFLPAYAAAGIELPPVGRAGLDNIQAVRGRGLIVAPPGSAGSHWLHRYRPLATGFASGWMQLGGTRRRQGMERGFVLSDHADWAGLTSAIGATGAERVLVTHGYVEQVVRWLGEQGYQAGPLERAERGVRNAENFDAQEAD